MQQNTGSNENKATNFAALSHWRWAQHQAEMEENTAKVFNMLEEGKTHPLRDCTNSKSNNLSSNIYDSSSSKFCESRSPVSPKGNLRRRRNASPLPTEVGQSTDNSNSATGINSKQNDYQVDKNLSNTNIRSREEPLTSKRIRLADIFPKNKNVSEISTSRAVDNSPCETTSQKNSVKRVAALGALRNKLLTEMGEDVWVEVKEQEDGWNWDQPVVAMSRDTFRASNAFNEDIFDFAIVLKNNLDDRTATAVREKRRLRRLNKQKKKETSSQRRRRSSLDSVRPGAPLSNHIENNKRKSLLRSGLSNSDEEHFFFSSSSSDGDVDDKEIVNDSAAPMDGDYMHNLQRERHKIRQQARYKIEDDDHDLNHSGPKTENNTENSIQRVRHFFAPVQLDGSKTLRAVVKRLRDAGLLVKRLKAADGKKTLLKIRAPQDRLEKEAERMHLIMRLRDGGWDRFRISMRDKFCGAGYDGVLFRSSDRQSILHNIIKLPRQYNGAGLGPESPYAPSIEMMFPLHMSARLRGLRSSWVKFWNPKMPSRFVSNNPVKSPKDSDYNDEKKSSQVSQCLDWLWNISFFGVLSQPLDAIAEYFGENVAFYFAWVQFYTKWLILPSIAGLWLFVLQVQSGSIDHPLLPFYSLFMAVWATFFLVFWRRRKHELAYRWGVLFHEDEEVPRPEFYGELRRSEIHGEWEMYYPKWKRTLKQVLSFPISGAWLGGILVGMVVLFNLRDNLIERLSDTSRIDTAAESTNNNAWLAQSPSPSPLTYKATAYATNATAGQGSSKNQHISEISDNKNSGFLHFGYTATSSDRMALNVYDSRHYGDSSFWAYLLLPPLAYGFMIPVLDALYKRLATQLNKWENHETESAYQNSLITKVVFFKLINAFCSLYYFAFSGRHPILRLTSQLASFMVAGQVLSNTKEILVPCLKYRVKQLMSTRQLKKAVHKSSLSKRRIRQATSKAWKESRKPIYDTFADYAEMIVQFGYVTFFSMAFPLAPVCALVNNIIEIRTDAYKLTYNTQRPVARKASGIGVWFPILQIMSIFALMTNLAIIAFTTGQVQYYFPDWSNTEKMFAVFVFEHIILIIMFLIYVFVPKMPRWVEIAVLKDQFKATGGVVNRCSSSDINEDRQMHMDSRRTSGPESIEMEDMDSDDALDESLMRDNETTECDVDSKAFQGETELEVSDHESQGTETNVPRQITDEHRGIRVNECIENTVEEEVETAEKEKCANDELKD